MSRSGLITGTVIDDLLREGPLPLRIAALDAYLAEVRPHEGAPGAGAEAVVLPSDTPEVRARARDAAIAGLLDIAPGAKVALIGVVNPLVAAIRERGGECLPCDHNLRTTQWGDTVAQSMADVLADAVVATGMTLSNGTFDEIVGRCRERAVPLVVYAQSGSAVARAIGSSIPFDNVDHILYDTIHWVGFTAVLAGSIDCPPAPPTSPPAGNAATTRTAPRCSSPPTPVTATRAPCSRHRDAPPIGDLTPIPVSTLDELVLPWSRMDWGRAPALNT